MGVNLLTNRHVSIVEGVHHNGIALQNQPKFNLQQKAKSKGNICIQYCYTISSNKTNPQMVNTCTDKRPESGGFSLGQIQWEGWGGQKRQPPPRSPPLPTPPPIDPGTKCCPIKIENFMQIWCFSLSFSKEDGFGPLEHWVWIPHSQLRENGHLQVYLALLFLRRHHCQGVLGIGLSMNTLCSSGAWDERDERTSCVAMHD